MSTSDLPGQVEADWRGAPMFFSHFDEETTRELVVSSGFEILNAERVVEVEEHGGEEDTFLWILATREDEPIPRADS